MPDMDYQRLAKWYWSPAFPTSYIVKGGGRTSGVGKIAFDYPGAFNLAWARYGEAISKASTIQERHDYHYQAVTYIAEVSGYVHVRFGAEELETYLLLLTQPEFESLYINKIRRTLPTKHVERIDKAFYEKV